LIRRGLVASVWLAFTALEVLEVMIFVSRGRRMTGVEEFIYARGELSVEQLQTEIAQFWQVLDNPGSSALDAELRAAGLDRARLADVDRENAITVHASTSGVDPTTAMLLVSLAPSANFVIKDAWKKVVLPYIQRRRGEDAIGEEKRGQD
jgi:hypothetical protein